MRKIEVAFTSLLLTSLISSVILISVRGESIEAMTSWANYAFKGTDSFYDKDVVAYETGSTAILVVSVKNDFGARINVSAVGISFDWQKPEEGWYNSTQASKENPVALENGETVYFTVNFTVPSIEVAQTVPHDYMVYVEHVNATGNLVERWNATRADLFGSDKQYFVVYSESQAKSQQMNQVIDGITEPTWNTTKAKLLWQRAMNESAIADYYYALGNFNQAVVHYGKALGLIDEAFTYEENKGASLEDAKINALEAQVKVAEAWANFANGLSNMWTLIGIALVLFALGYIIRGLAALRRTPVPP
jgi:tetratricopeptide (TPR) repeat protein